MNSAKKQLNMKKLVTIVLYILTCLVIYIHTMKIKDIIVSKFQVHMKHFESYSLSNKDSKLFSLEKFISDYRYEEMSKLSALKESHIENNGSIKYTNR